MSKFQKGLREELTLNPLFLQWLKNIWFLNFVVAQSENMCPKEMQMSFNLATIS